MKVVLQGSPVDPGAQCIVDISPREMMLGQAFRPLQPEDLDTLALDEPLKVGLALSRWYVRAGELSDGTPRFVFARIAPARLDS